MLPTAGNDDLIAASVEVLGKGASVVSQAVELLEKERAAAAQARAEVEELRAQLAAEREAVQRETQRLKQLERETRSFERMNAGINRVMRPAES